MHELSIATALLDLVAQHTPPGTVVRRVVIDAGPLQGLDAEAMQWAWRSIIANTPCAQSQLEIEFLPWDLHCPACGRDWKSGDMNENCTCGSSEAHPVGGRDLVLKTLVVDDGADEEKSDASPGDRERSEAQ